MRKPSLYLRRKVMLTEEKEKERRVNLSIKTRYHMTKNVDLLF
jgi:hypothetical protein